MNKTTEKLLGIISSYKGNFDGAYHIREDGLCAGIQSSKNITITEKKDKPGIDIHIAPNTKGETVYIPACVTHGNVNDLVYNDFYVGAGAEVTIVAGCGVHTDNEGEAKHNGIHRFILEKGAHVLYKEKHIGTGKGTGMKKIDPVTDAVLEEGAILEMNTIQLGGVDLTTRSTKAVLDKNAKVVVHESIMTDGDEKAQTNVEVKMNGDGSSANLVSRSVAKGHSRQHYHSCIEGNCKCNGHSECDAILQDQGSVSAAPELFAANTDAALIHEAAIGKIAEEQIIKLRTLGLTREEAEAKIIEGFLR